MANKIYNVAGGLHSAAAYSAFEAGVYNHNAIATADSFKVTSASGLNVTIAKGQGLVKADDEFSRRIGLTEPITVALDAGDTSLPRVDSIVLYVDNSVQATTDVLDNTNNMLKVGYVKGTPNASPTAPSASDIYQVIGAENSNYLLIANVKMPAGASSVTSGNIEDKRPKAPNVYYEYIPPVPQPKTIEQIQSSASTGVIINKSNIPKGKYLILVNVELNFRGSSGDTFTKILINDVLAYQRVHSAINAYFQSVSFAWITNNTNNWSLKVQFDKSNSNAIVSTDSTRRPTVQIIEL